MTEHDIEPGQEYEFDQFRPEDAEGIVRLFRLVYGETYPIRTFVDPKVLIEENKAGRTVSAVARTSKGDIVGHNAIYQSAAWPGTYESGAGLVHPAYRGGKGIFYELGGPQALKSIKKVGGQALFGEPVMNHLFAQKAVHKFGWPAFALEVDLTPAAPDMVSSRAGGRVSALVCSQTVVPRPHPVFLPDVYRAPLKYCYEALDDERTFSDSTAVPEKKSTTTIKTQVFDFAQVARLAIWSVGSDWMDKFQAEEQRLIANGTLVVQVWLPLSDPAVGEMAKGLRKWGYFFGGLLPRWFDGDGMLMQKLLVEPGWDAMQIETERARGICDMVKEDWQAVNAG